MAKIDKNIHNYRMNGAAWMLKYVKENGVEEAETELKKRVKVKIPFEVSTEQMDRFCQDVRNEMLDAVLVLSSSILIDKYDFTAEQLSEYIRSFNGRAECVGDDYVSWMDIIEQIEEDCKIKLNMRNLTEPGEGTDAE